jgi:hypothetical protein
MTLLAAVQIDETVLERAPEIGLQCALGSEIEPIYLLNSLHGRLLNDIVGLEHTTGACRQSSPGPAAKPGEIQPDQCIQGRAIAGLGTLQKLG